MKEQLGYAVEWCSKFTPVDAIILCTVAAILTPMAASFILWAMLS